jgi:serine/threonine protein phosphatase PrpC
MTLQFRAVGVTDVGRVRDHNEDGFMVDDSLGLVALADGMGGHRAGEVASAAALDALRIAFGAGSRIDDAVAAANDIVYEQSLANDTLRGMGTTLTAAAFGVDGTLLLGHVGDSRAYLLRDDSLERVTTDHSLVEELIEAGEITREEAETDSRRSMITRAIGLEPGVLVDLETVELREGDRLLLCSDGLTDMVREQEVAELLRSEHDPAAAAQRLVDAANDAGGVDNITVVVVDLEEGGEPDEEPVAEGSTGTSGSPAAEDEAPGEEPETDPPSAPDDGAERGGRGIFRRRKG